MNDQTTRTDLVYLQDESENRKELILIKYVS